MGTASRRGGVLTATVPFAAPFRLDLTVAALQRVATNAVDVWTVDRRYVRAFETPAGPVVWEVSQEEGRGSLRLRLHGPAGAFGPWKALVRRMLGTDVDLAPFHAAAAAIPALAELADRLRGLKPPRFADLWESLVSVIPFQQVSLASATAAVARLARRCAPPVALDGIELHPFPGPRAVRALSDADLRGCGLSAAKARSLRAAADAILGGALREEDLERLPDEEVSARLMELPGVGPWTASLVLLRGMRRLTSFPVGDSGAERRLQAALGPVDERRLLERLGSLRGMLYFHLLLASRFPSAVPVRGGAPAAPGGMPGPADRARRGRPERTRGSRVLARSTGEEGRR